MNHISASLPALKERINEMVATHEKMRHTLGDLVTEPEKTLVQMLIHFAEAYCQTIDGTVKETDAVEIRGGAKISLCIFYDTFAKELEEVKPLGGLTEEKVICALRNATV